MSSRFGLALGRARGSWALLLVLCLGCRQIAGIDDLSELDRVRRLEQTPCTRNSECAERYDDKHICRHSDKRCVPLLSAECNELSGDYLDDNALIFGSIEPVTGLDSATGKSVRRAIQLAVEDFQLAKGIPLGAGKSERRPIAFVHCNDTGEADVAVEAARHLAKTVRVPAIVGAAFSGVTLDVATLVTIEQGTLLMSPSATSSAITDLNDEDLVWRTTPSDTVQAKAQAQVVSRVEKETRILRDLARDALLTITVLHKGDAYGVGLAEDVLVNLTWNGFPATAKENRAYVLRHDYGDPSNEATRPTQYADAVAKTLQELPDVVLLYGTAEVGMELLAPIELGWPELAARPRYVMADGGRTDDVRAAIEQVDPEGRSRLATRVIGTEPGSLSQDQATFRARYTDRMPDPNDSIAFGAANAFDAVYLLALGAVAARVPQPTGTQLADGLWSFLPSPGESSTPLAVGPSFINAAIRLVEDGKRLRLAGASGPLNFDLATGDVLSDILLWCAQVDAMKHVTLAPYGESYETRLETIVTPGSLSRCGW